VKLKPYQGICGQQSYKSPTGKIYEAIQSQLIKQAMKQEGNGCGKAYKTKKNRTPTTLSKA
jgi:hypothetical protein